MIQTPSVIGAVYISLSGSSNRVGCRFHKSSSSWDLAFHLNKNVSPLFLNVWIRPSPESSFLENHKLGGVLEVQKNFPAPQLFDLYLVSSIPVKTRPSTRIRHLSCKRHLLSLPEIIGRKMNITLVWALTLLRSHCPKRSCLLLYLGAFTFRTPNICPFKFGYWN